MTVKYKKFVGWVLAPIFTGTARLPLMAMICCQAGGIPHALSQTPQAHDDLSAVVAIEQALVEVIARAEKSVVAISHSITTKPSSLFPDSGFPGSGDPFQQLRSEFFAQAEPVTTGAGVIIDPAGLILTQYLVVGIGEQHTITTINGKTYPANIQAADPRSGLAILAIAPGTLATESSFPAIPFGNAAELRKGQFVVTIGNPYAIRHDGEASASWGIVSNIAAKAPQRVNLNNTPGPQGDYRTSLHHLGTLIQTDAKLGWSTGGGALVNLRGRLVGITTTAATIAGHEQPAGYAIPINPAFERVIDRLKQGKEVEYGLLGVSFRQESPASISSSGKGYASQKGVTIHQVYPGSPASRADLQPGDRITHVGNRPVVNVDQLQLAVSINPPSHITTVRYERGGRSASAEVTLAKLAIAGKKVISNRPPGWRGIHVDYATALDTATLAEQTASGALDPQGCVVVAEVEPESPAWKAGVRAGMFISHVGSTRVTTPAEFREAVKQQTDTLNIRLTQPK